MALIEIKTDLSRLTKAVERIAEALERAFPIPSSSEPSMEDVDFYQLGEEDPAKSSDELWRDYAPRSNY